MTSDASVAVVGGGIVGLSTAYALLRRGVAVHVYDRGVPGQSGGTTRILRHGHDDPRLVSWARHGRELWEQWSRDLGEPLITTDGAVFLGPAVRHQVEVLRDQGVPARLIGTDELRQCMPVLASYPDPALLDERAGAIHAHAAITRLRNALGSAVVTDEVLAVHPTSAGTVEVRLATGSREYASVVVCAGVDTARLARGAGIDLPVQRTCHVRATFRVAGAAPDRLACLQDRSGWCGETAAYAAALPGQQGLAVGVGSNLAPDLATSEHTTGVVDRIRRYVTQALPGLDAEPVALRHCWVTSLPWGPDAMAVWQHNTLLVFAGNNAFKHGPALGEHLAQAATGQPLAEDLRPESRLGAPPAQS